MALSAMARGGARRSPREGLVGRLLARREKLIWTPSASIVAATGSPAAPATAVEVPASSAG
jgi:hypothetical protein